MQNQSSKPLCVAIRPLLPPHETRWTLRTLGTSVSWLNGMSIPGVRSVLYRLGISYKRGRPYMRSPDVEYIQKLASVKQALEQAAQHPETHVAFYQDEFAFRRQPMVAKRLDADRHEAPTRPPKH